MQKSKNKIYDAVCVILAAFTLFFLVLTVMYSAGMSVNFKGAVVTAALVIGGILTAGSLFFRHPSASGYGAVKRVGFYLTHAGVVLLLIGFALFELAGDTVSAAVPVGSDSYYSQIQRESGEMCDLGFNFRIDNFETEYYADTSEGVKQYYAQLSFADEITLRVEKAELSVNHTVRRGGWKIYLMNYSGGYVNLLFRSDPGEYVVKSGAAVIIAGCITSLIAGNTLIPRSRKQEEGRCAK